MGRMGWINYIHNGIYSSDTNIRNIYTCKYDFSLVAKPSCNFNLAYFNHTRGWSSLHRYKCGFRGELSLITFNDFRFYINNTPYLLLWRKCLHKYLFFLGCNMHNHIIYIYIHKLFIYRICTIYLVWVGLCSMCMWKCVGVGELYISNLVLDFLSKLAFLIIDIKFVNYFHFIRGIRKRFAPSSTFILNNHIYFASAIAFIQSHTYIYIIQKLGQYLTKIDIYIMFVMRLYAIRKIYIDFNELQNTNVMPHNLWFVGPLLLLNLIL